MYVFNNDIYNVVEEDYFRMKSEIMQELENNIKEIQKLIENQDFKVSDANKFLKRYTNIYNSMNKLSKSRDNWRNKYMDLKDSKIECI